METNKNEIQKAEPAEIQQAQANHLPIPADAPLMTRVAMMMERGIKIDTDQMKQMLEIAQIVKATAAKDAYAADFSVVQANIDAALKSAHNPQTGKKYADLEGVIEAAKPAYTKEGFSVFFYEGETEKKDHIRVCADLMHKEGHKVTSHYDVPLGGVGIKGNVNMTAIHAKATSMTYGRRYLLCNMFNIPTADTDGNPPKDDTPKERPKPNKAQQAFIDALIEKLPHVEGKVYNKQRLGLWISGENEGKYPSRMESLDKAAEHVVKEGKEELYMDDDTFENKYNIEPDEDSKSDNPL